MKSTHQVEVVEVKLTKHPNADSLSIVKIDGFQVVVRTSDWKDGDLGAYIKPDTLVHTGKPIFRFLGDKMDWFRVGVKKLRGEISMGLLVKAPIQSNIGDDVSSVLGTKRYEPPAKINHGNNIKPPNIYTVKYDIDSVRKYNKVFEEGELTYVSEKIHGCLKEGSQVKTVDGHKNIEDIKINDEVISYNEKSRCDEKDFVTNVLVRDITEELDWFELVFDNGSKLVCTEDHLIYTNNRGWVCASDLEEFDDIKIDD